MTQSHKKTFIAGGSGFLGGHLIDHFLEKKMDIYASYRKGSQKNSENLKWLSIDLKTPALSKVIDGFDHVIICSGIVGGVNAFHDKPHYPLFETLQSYLNILRSCIEARVPKITLVSTASIYPLKEEALEECDDQIDPYDRYFGLAHAYKSIEKMAEYAHRQFGIDVTIVRPSNIYGPRDRFDPIKAHVLPSLLRRAYEKQDPFIVWGSPDTERDFIYVDDIVKGILLAGDKITNAEAINLSYGSSVKIGDLVKMILKISKHRPSKLIFDDSKPTAIPLRRISNEKAQKTLGFKPMISLEEGIYRTLEWYKENKND